MGHGNLRRETSKLRRSSPNTKHNPHENHKLQNGFVVNFIVIIKKRLPSVKVRKFLFNTQNVRKILD